MIRVRTGQLLVAACFVALTATACGGANNASVGTGGGPVLTTGNTAAGQTMIPAPSPIPVPTSVAPPAKPPAGGTNSVPPAQIDSGAMTTPPQGVQVTGDGKQVVFNAEQSGCQQVSAQATTQTATQVTIQVITTNTNKGNQMCPMIVRVVQVSAELTAPLGNRKIVFQQVTKHS